MFNFRALGRSARLVCFLVAFSGGIILSGCQADTLTGVDTTVEADSGGGTSTTDQHNEGNKSGGGTSTTDQHNEG